jgi:BspA type Leucine rich repeat region (6 copies)/Carboxypeptidase regulatory-like domain
MLAVLASVHQAIANSITGTVLYNGNPVAGVGVNASAVINNTNDNSYADTAANGTYSLNVANGTWTVGVNCSGGSDSLQGILGTNFQCPNDVTFVISNDNAIANFIVPPATNDDQIIGHVVDNDGNPVAGVNVYANNSVGVTYTNTTDSTGYYSFFVYDGTWTVSVDCQQLNSLGYACVDSEQLGTCCGITDEGDFTPQIGGNSGYFGYSVEDGQVTIDSYNGPGGAVTIPGTISNLPVTSIASDAFANNSMTGVIIPDSVTNIEGGAFLGCSLTNVTVPNSVIFIGTAAFADCFTLVSVTLGTNVASIGDAAFGSCDNLVNINIPASVTNFGDDPFVGCSSLPAINVAPGNPAYASPGGVLFNYNLSSLIQYPAGSSATNYTVPASVTNIGDYAFYVSDSLTSVTIGGNLTTIGYEAFSFCQDLSSFYFLGDAPATDPSAFQGTDNGYLDATIYYLSGTTGWTSPFQGLPAVMISAQPGVPLLALVPDSGNAVLSWPTNAAGFVLQSSTNLASPVNWIDVSLSPILIGGQDVVIVPMSGQQQFYRLKQLKH